LVASSTLTFVGTSSMSGARTVTSWVPLAGAEADPEEPFAALAEVLAAVADFVWAMTGVASAHATVASNAPALALIRR
jgi:di/tricarboxylate transporter